jgi:hypothetical protein
MSEISKALQALGRERREQQASTNRGLAQVVVSTVNEADLLTLVERLAGAAEMVKQERQRRMDAEESVLDAKAAFNEQTLRIDALERELHSRNIERRNVRQRVTRMLTELDSLEI